MPLKYSSGKFSLETEVNLAPFYIYIFSVPKNTHFESIKIPSAARRHPEEQEVWLEREKEYGREKSLVTVVRAAQVEASKTATATTTPSSAPLAFSFSVEASRKRRRRLSVPRHSTPQDLASLSRLSRFLSPYPQPFSPLGRDVLFSLISALSDEAEDEKSHKIFLSLSPALFSPHPSFSPRTVRLIAHFPFLALARGPYFLRLFRRVSRDEGGGVGEGAIAEELISFDDVGPMKN